MKDGFLKVAAVTPVIRVADPAYNAGKIEKAILAAEQNKAKVVVLPELCLTGYTCGELFLQENLIREARKQIVWLAQQTKEMEALIFVGMPLEHEDKLYNTAAVLHRGRILAFVPKSNLPEYAEFYEARYFVPAQAGIFHVEMMGERIPFGTDLLFYCAGMDGLMIGCEICEDAWVLETPGTKQAKAGAHMIVNLSASDELAGKAEYRRLLVKTMSARLLCAYIYASAGEGESTQDVVYGGHSLISENGMLLAESRQFTTGELYADIDLGRIKTERRRMSTFITNSAGWLKIPFDLTIEETHLKRNFSRMPFVPSDQAELSSRLEEIIMIQAYGLKKRMEHTGCKQAVIGISGGLDSTLALLVLVRTFSLIGLDPSGILAVTMPCFGTTDRTYKNACNMTKILGAKLKEVDIKQAVLVHFGDIGQEETCHDVTFENSQARERTQVLMDLANKTGGMVIGTGDMSELALGWATYNGDHMSMYGVNAGIPKTLVRYLVQYFADTCDSRELQRVLFDVLDTPVSPELLPPEKGDITQKTEDLVGPYELHDFYLYYMLRLTYPPRKIFRIALSTFEGIYDRETILKWLKIFYRRFFSQQFKRSCLPDGPKVGSVALSPRGDLRMPSDASADLWLKEVGTL